MFLKQPLQVGQPFDQITANATLKLLAHLKTIDKVNYF